MPKLPTTLRKIALGYYLVMPYFALVAVSIVKGKGAGALFLTGWLCVIIYQLFLLSINQAAHLKGQALYKQSSSFVVVGMVLLNQLVFDGNIWLFFIEQMLLELVVLLFGLLAAFIVLIKKDARIAIMGFVLIGLFTGGTVYGLVGSWLELTAGRSVLSWIPLAIGFTVGSISNYRLLIAVARKQIQLEDSSSFGSVILIVVQPFIWFILPTIVSMLYSV